MNVSQALRRVKDLKGALSDLHSRGRDAVTHRKDTSPAYDFSNVLESIAKMQTALIEMQTKVAISNATTSIRYGGGMTVAQAVRMLAEIKGEIAWLKSLAIKPQKETIEQERDYDETLSKFVLVTKTTVCHMPESSRDAAVAALTMRFSEINDLVEASNHATLV